MDDDLDRLLHHEPEVDYFAPQPPWLVALALMAAAILCAAVVYFRWQ